ncbi:MAG: winged helix-turn-helix domain-containing protein [Parcubacteria group bacterium]|nr:winged helix-turn-helix domain-containing protein [Parcubacteria group bacterium]
MSNLTLIIIAVVGISLGYYLANRSKGVVGVSSKRSKEKQENKQKILDYLYENGRVTNNNVEKLTGVTHSSVERYLDELEKEGKITQHGNVGTDVFYTLK